MDFTSLWERHCIHRGQQRFRIVALRSKKSQQQKMITSQKEKLFHYLGAKVFFRKLWGGLAFLFLVLCLPVFPETIAAWDMHILGINDFQLLSDFNPFLFAAGLFCAIFWLDSMYEIVVCKEQHSTKFNAKIRVYDKKA